MMDVRGKDINTVIVLASYVTEPRRVVILTSTRKHADEIVDDYIGHIIPPRKPLILRKWPQLEEDYAGPPLDVPSSRVSPGLEVYILYPTLLVRMIEADRVEERIDVVIIVDIAAPRRSPKAVGLAIDHYQTMGKKILLLTDATHIHDYPLID